MNKRISKVTMTDNPEWGEAEFARARPATEVFTELFGKEGAEKVIKPVAGQNWQTRKNRLSYGLITMWWTPIGRRVMDGKPK